MFLDKRIWESNPFPVEINPLTCGMFYILYSCSLNDALKISCKIISI